MSRFTTHMPMLSRVLITIGKVNLSKLILLFCLSGVTMYMCGIYMETGANFTLRRAGGDDAVQMHRTRLAENALGPILYLRKGLLGQLQQHGANEQVRGAAILYGGSLLAVVIVFLCRCLWHLQVRYSPVAGVRAKADGGA